ncbi:hypothetical protein JI721_09910 [Alicyclobacillus cycloheptanicus]|uniref:Uncharacterized protein n=1 Tax=Alicyclobacillus cycloheptanicus TaxID=1457 RepID=A0ABT9XJ14_9BACL|nr:hypothetical protein [Alicyclobacillus cycloheptanicus]MDQ0190024.1 hypothetical protein [Alicyclobacillus cycloheptanicus]WDM00074.1 hypothetical protein JI721_09910 [Alicyclobacillus cycloheptanicus]
MRWLHEAPPVRLSPAALGTVTMFLAVFYFFFTRPNAADDGTNQAQ